jgi:hypothetical protein
VLNRETRNRSNVRRVHNETAPDRLGRLVSAGAIALSHLGLLVQQHFPSWGLDHRLDLSPQLLLPCRPSWQIAANGNDPPDRSR